ncbi:hypothetical protein [Methylocella silvestris]|uniref:hypothetical protein n=1 Tax=Methylocella silvestris TaxID=199596 RepID=UPI0011AEE99C|nr:hypothetical protein [Methylocella silvestris]
MGLADCRHGRRKSRSAHLFAAHEPASSDKAEYTLNELKSGISGRLCKRRQDRAITGERVPKLGRKLLRLHAATRDQLPRDHSQQAFCLIEMLARRAMRQEVQRARLHNVLDRGIGDRQPTAPTPPHDRGSAHFKDADGFPQGPAPNLVTPLDVRLKAENLPHGPARRQEFFFQSQCDLGA